MNPFRSIGKSTLDLGSRCARVAAIGSGAVALACWFPFWRRPVRRTFAEQVLASGVEAVPFLGAIACLIGTTAVLQFQVWIATLGQSQYLGPVLVAVVIREIGPLIVNLVIIARSGNATVAEIVAMVDKGRFQRGDSLRLDPMIHLVMPRAAAWTVSALCLMVFFVYACFVSGYLFAFLFDIRTGTPTEFLVSLLRAITTADIVNVVAKTTIPPILTAALCCDRGLSVQVAPADASKATAQTVEYAVLMLLSVNTLISIAAYI